MKTIVLLAVNVPLLFLFALLLRKSGLLSYYRTGKWWLTWLSIGIITLMDELTSVFYAPAEAYRFIGPGAIIFIALTSLLVRFMCNRLVEIAEILEHHKIIGGGVYSFSYLVLGPVASFVAVSSIMVDYILTACISAVSAVENATSFFLLSSPTKMGLVLLIIWAVAGLNILGIRENARFTFMIFIAAAFVFVNLIASGIVSLDKPSLGRLADAALDTTQHFRASSLFGGYGFAVASMASCILAYSGVESVLQTAGLVRSWREISKAYMFLALTVGLVTPLTAALALSAPIDFQAHEGDLITHYATLLNGVPFGVIVAALASFTLTMAVNTAFVASSELLERVAHRYGFHWLIVTNRSQSLYRIHLVSATFFSAIIFITHGNQMILADMYAIGLVASFCINMGSLIIYRYFMGTKEVIPYYTSRVGTLVLFIILVSCFTFLAYHKPHGTTLWASISVVVLGIGLFVAKRRAPEIKEIEQSEAEMDMILYLAESSKPDLHIVFQRPRDESLDQPKENEAYVTFYSPRQGIPPKLAPNHFRFPLIKTGLYQRLVAFLKVVEHELSHQSVTVYFGWPLSSWIDRMAIGVMVFNLMRLPKLFPQFEFIMRYRKYCSIDVPSSPSSSVE